MSKPSDSQIEEQMHIATEAMDEGSNYPGMSFEEGVEAALMWVLGIIDTPPLEDEREGEIQ